MKYDSFKEFVTDQLSGFENVIAKAMFGGWGLYAGGVFFGIIFKGKIYFKTGEKSVKEYKKAGMKPFRPSSKMTLKHYYEVPVDVLEDRSRLSAWAKQAAQA